MTGTTGNGVAGRFARQMKKERLAHGWSIAELARRMGDADPAHLGRVENGRRPPTAQIAAGLDAVFPERHGWFTDWLGIAGLPHVTLTVMPAVAHAANPSGFVLADDAAWCEHLAAGGVYTDPNIVSALAARFDSLRAESYRASESLALIDRTRGIWATGASPLTQTATAVSA